MLSDIRSGTVLATRSFPIVCARAAPPGGARAPLMPALMRAAFLAATGTRLG